MVTVPASRPSPEAGSPISRATRNKPSRVLHEPFVSPEFGASRATGPSRLGGGPDSSDRGEISPAEFRGDGDTIDRRSWQGQQALLPQAAPLYTVSATSVAGSGGGVVSAPPSALSNSMLPGKRLEAVVAGYTSVVGPPSARRSAPAAGSQEVQFQTKSDKTPSPYPSSREIEVEGTLNTSLDPPQDLSPFVTEATCTWGQELGAIVGQAVNDSSRTANRRLGIQSSGGQPTLTTTGLFPQMMTLRFSSSVRVKSVHVRASSVLNLVVHSSEGLLGSVHADSKAVTLPADGQHKWPREEGSGRDIDVDVRGAKSFENTRSITVVITAGSGTFCSIHRIYARGFRA
ncbi:unnamed protein product [Ectocarpus sp. 13 AM-2016]